MAKRPGVRLSGGAYGGRVLAVPPGARPTEGRVREALFSIWGGRLRDARVLDLFAGSGAVGLEAAGRGAAEVLAIEGDGRAAVVLAGNRERLAAREVEIRRLRLPSGLAGLAREPRRFDLVYADPPYDFLAYGQLLAELPALLAADAEVVIEHASRVSLPLVAGRLVRIDERSYGESSLSFYRLGPGG